MELSKLEYERQLVVNMLHSPELIDEAMSNPDFDSNCFSDPVALKTFEWIKKRYSQAKEINKAKLITESNIDFKTLTAPLMDLDFELIDNEEIIEHLIKLKTRRTLIKSANTIIEIAQKNDLSKEEYENKAQEIIFSVTNNINHNKGIYEMNDLLNLFWEELAIIQDNGGKTVGLPTGIGSLDKITGGLQKGHLTVIAASTHRGKTSLALCIALNVLELGKKVAFISLEMKASEVIRKLISLESKVPTSAYMTKLKEYQKLNTDKSLSKLMDMNLTVSDERGLTPSDIKARCRKIARKHNGLDLIIIDYLQNINYDRGDTENQQIGYATLDMRNLAGELDVPVILISQFSRSANSKDKPEMSDTRGSGRIEEIADDIWLPYRPNFDANLEKQLPEEANIIVDKGRTSGRGIVEMIFYPTIQYWRDKKEEDYYGPLQINA